MKDEHQMEMNETSLSNEGVEIKRKISTLECTVKLNSVIIECDQKIERMRILTETCTVKKVEMISNGSDMKDDIYFPPSDTVA